MISNNIQIQSAHKRAVHAAHRSGRDCLSVHITADEDISRWGARPRAEIIPEQNFEIGSTVSYEVDILIPDDFDAYTKDGDPAAYSVFQFHQHSDITPPVPFTLQVMGDEMRGKGHANTGEWFTSFNRIYVPEEWTNWRVITKWSTSDGWRKVYRNGQMVDEHHGDTCSEDIKAPYLKVGLQRGDWDLLRARYVRAFYSDIKIEQLVSLE